MNRPSCPTCGGTGRHSGMDACDNWCSEPCPDCAGRKVSLADLVERLRTQAEEVAQLYGDAQPPEDDLKPADILWWTVQDAIDEITHLRAEVAELQQQLAIIKSPVRE